MVAVEPMPGDRVARMRMLEAMVFEHGVGLNDLWVWPIHRLRLALAWSDFLVDQVDRYRRACGASRIWMFPTM